jgi:hypothetical protein
MKIFLLFIIIYLSMVIYYDNNKTPPVELPKVEMPNPLPDSTREVEDFSWERMEWKYKDERHIKIESSKIYQADQEVQLIINGIRYRVQYQGDGSHKLIPIR